MFLKRLLNNLLNYYIFNTDRWIDTGRKFSGQHIKLGDVFALTPVGCENVYYIVKMKEDIKEKMYIVVTANKSEETYPDGTYIYTISNEKEYTQLDIFLNNKSLKVVDNVFFS